MNVREGYAEVLRLRIAVLDARLERLQMRALATAPIRTQQYKFAAGDEVQATAAFAATIRSNRRCRVDAKRRGIVKSCNTSDAMVHWNGTKYADKVPVRALERVTS